MVDEVAVVDEVVVVDEGDEGDKGDEGDEEGEGDEEVEVLGVGVEEEEPVVGEAVTLVVVVDVVEEAVSVSSE